MVPVFKRRSITSIRIPAGVYIDQYSPEPASVRNTPRWITMLFEDLAFAAIAEASGVSKHT